MAAIILLRHTLAFPASTFGIITRFISMETNFTAIDFETAQGYRWSICQVGLVRVVNGQTVAKLDLLIQPPDNYYWNKFIDIHGITPDVTQHAPAFNEVWPVLEPFIANQNVVAHNGAFDFSCLKQTLEWYGVNVPDFKRNCTYRIFNKSLDVLCDEQQIELNHHNALSDASACAALYLFHLNQLEII